MAYLLSPVSSRENTIQSFEIKRAIIRNFEEFRIIIERQYKKFTIYKYKSPLL